MEFKFYMPTMVYTGKGCIGRNSALFGNFGKKALLVTGRSSAVKNGSLNDVTAVLKSKGIDYAVFDRVMTNPTVDCVYEGAAFAREFGADFIVSMGGGSPMDAAKAIALLTVKDIPRSGLFEGDYGDRALPMIFVPTTAGTGSEVTPYSILTNEQAGTKMSISSPVLFPKIAFVDASYTASLPPEGTVNTAVDALSHAVEGMLSTRASAVSDASAAGAIGLIMSAAEELTECAQGGTGGNGLSFEVREKLLVASMMAGIVIAQTGTTVVHSMGYSLTYYKGLDHGRANGVLLGAYLKFVQERNPELAGKVFSAMGMADAADCIRYFGSLLGPMDRITEEELQSFSERAVKTKNVKNSTVPPGLDDILRIYRESLEIGD